MRGSPTSDMPMIGHGFGLSWQKRWKAAASFSGRIARLPCTYPLATPAVVAAMPARQSRRACRLGRIFVAPVLPCGFFASSIFIKSAPCLDRWCGTVLPCGSAPRTTRFSEGRMTKIASNLQIDSARLWDSIFETAKFGATPKGGVRRLTLGPEDKQVRDWFRKACEAAGLDVHVDALEVVRTLNDAGIETEMPICICNWTNEEGSRFAPAMMASAAYVGDFTTDDILSRKDAEGVTVAQALDSIGYRGATAVGMQKFSGFVELHIEQGPILEAENKTIGVVDSGQGVLWYDGKIV